ncbi:TetR family transcriptional regulator [Microbispora sp. NEAU-D428]|uniref:TetR/AcrR family transcriptional regulator n=1 Tax=Microbispora sitophila TaxID=2771537 RepID=UPI0018694121|nr:TetR family transcriptional regulator [Microbispora sitophila]MBE3009131.1 TetR family transcriptional regulator [Microbispora sitophila]
MGRVSAQDWARAALDALAEDGFAAVAVEPVAARLGVTKGSFYWHFANRRKLIEAALALWEADSEQIIANLWEITDPARRMRTLLGAAFGDPRDAAIAFRLIGAADDPAVAEVARRVTARRLEVMRQTLEELGQSPDLARRRVLAGYGVYVGVAALRRIGMLDDPAEFVETAVAEMGLDLPR